VKGFSENFTEDFDLYRLSKVKVTSNFVEGALISLFNPFQFHYPYYYQGFSEFFIASPLGDNLLLSRFQCVEDWGSIGISFMKFLSIIA